MTSSTPRKLLDLITLVDNVPLAFEDDCSPYYRLYLAPDPRPHGYILPETVASMPWPPAFTISHARRSVTLAPPPSDTSLGTHANAAFQEAVDKAIDDDVFAILHKAHSEYFQILGAKGFVQVERFAGPLFGIAMRGAHLTGYVKDGDNLKIWVARRNRKLFTYPGLLDSTVAGGVKATDTPLDCILAESVEEASLSHTYVQAHVKSVGVITLANRNPRTALFHSEVLYVYDLEMPADMTPVPGDDEVEEFILMDVGEVRERMLAGEFKPNVCSVMVDFLVRHGVVTPEGEKDYAQLCGRLRRRVPVPTSADMEWP
ncbi:Fc.00g032300.m01.CDS01 [Cosmosporella sp. VM-42]